MLKSEAAAYLAGVTQTEGAEASAPTNLHVITGEVGEASADGKTLVKIDGLMFSESDDQFIEVDALGGLEEGDIATIVLTGEQGHAMTPLALGSIGSVDRITVRIAAIEADYIKVEQLDAATARIGELEADHVSVDDLNAATARIGTLETTRATITDLEAAKARIGTLEADHVSTDDLNAATARIGTLETNTADIDTIRANSAKVQNLTAAELEADHATVGSLSTNYAHITNGVIDNATIGYADVNNLSAHYAEIQNGKINSALIDTAAIVDEQVFTVTGNKATLAQIDASKINVLNLKAKDIEVERINGQPVTNKTLVDALSQHETDISGLDAKIDNEVEALNDRIDGAIETFTGTVVPTLNNTPASQWNTVALKDQHVGDVYYVVNDQSAQNGYCYRFTKSGSTYSWQLIKDSDVTAALSRLQTAEGKITSIEQFDVTVGSFMTDTDDEISSLKTRATTLETSMGDKVDTSTFNTVSQKVDANEANITSMSTVLTNNGLTSSTNITNTVNTVKQTATGNSSKITQLTTTLGTNADGTTKTGDIVHRTSAVEQDLSGITTRVGTLESTTTAHGTRLTNAETSISQNTDAIALRATKTEVQQVRPAYASSSTAAGTAAKVATIDPAVTGYSLYKGASVAVTFSKANTAATPTLNLNSTGAKQIRSYTGATLSEAEYKWAAGATIDLVYDGTYWRMQDGGSVKRVTAAEASIRVNADNIESKVSKDGVISSINQSAETVKIQASKVEIDGTAVFSAISSDVDDAITSKGYQTSSQVNSAITSKGYQTSSQVESAITSKGYQTASQVSTAVTNGTANLATKANAVKRTQRIWYRKSASGAPSTPGTASSNWVTKADDGNDAWTKMHIAISSTHKYIYTCEQYEMANGTVGYTSVLLDNTITVIDGGNVITHTITAEQIDAASINASKSLTVGAMTDAAASTILNSNVVVGGDNLVGNFNYTLVQNATYDYSTGTLTSLTTTNTANHSVYIQAMTGTTSTSAGTSVRQLANLGNASNVGQIIHGTFEKTADFTHIKLKFNGNKSDADVFWDLSSISTGTQLTLSCKLDSISSDGKGNGGVLSGINLRAGNAASQWSLAPQDEIIGGRNLLTGTGDWSGSYQTSGSGSSSGDTFTFSAHTSLSWYSVNLSYPHMPFSDVDGQTLTLGFDYRSDDFSDTSGDHYVYINAAASATETGGRTKYKQISTSEFDGVFIPTTEWQRGSITFVLSESLFNAGSGECNHFYIQFYNHTLNSLQLRHVKLERGNKATDWSPAPEDMATAESLAGTNESLEGAITDIGELSDQLVGTVSEQNKTITDIQTYLNSLRQDLDAEIQSRQQWLNFNSAEGLVIGAAGSSFKTVTTNTSQQFRSGGTVLAETSGTEFVAPVMRSDQLLIGNWMWTRRDNGNLSLKWIG